MSDPKEKEVQAILQAIDYGHLPPRETQRRLLNIIQAEAARTDAPTDETKIHTCMDLLERLQGEQKPIAPARVDALRQHIAAAHQKNERKRRVKNDTTPGFGLFSSRGLDDAPQKCNCVCSAGKDYFAFLYEMRI